MDEESDTIAELEDRIEQLEATTKKMMPTRRDALKFGGAAAIGAAAMSGTASAGSSQVGTIGDSNNLVDVEAEDIDVSDTLTTQDIVVNGTATGPFGGGIQLESGDSIYVEYLGYDQSNSTMQTLYSGSAKDVLGGVISGGQNLNWYYEFSDNTIINKNATGKNYSSGNDNITYNENGDRSEIDFLPPAKDVIEIGVGNSRLGSSRLAAEAILTD